MSAERMRCPVAVPQKHNRNSYDACKPPAAMIQRRRPRDMAELLAARFPQPDFRTASKDSDEVFRLLGRQYTRMHLSLARRCIEPDTTAVLRSRHSLHRRRHLDQRFPEGVIAQGAADTLPLSLPGDSRVVTRQRTTVSGLRMRSQCRQ